MAFCLQIRGAAGDIMPDGSVSICPSLFKELITLHVPVATPLTSHLAACHKCSEVKSRSAGLGAAATADYGKAKVHSLKKTHDRFDVACSCPTF